MADEVADCPNMMLELLREGQCRTHQPRNALAERVVEPLNVIGEPGCLRDRFVAVGGNHAGIHYILIRVERGLLSIHRWKVRPQLPCALATAITNMKGNDLAGGSVDGQP
jgi:hypothetical protein